MKPGDTVKLLGKVRNVDQPGLVGQTATVVQVDEAWTFLDFGENALFYMHRGNKFVDKPLPGKTGWWWRTNYLEVVE